MASLSHFRFFSRRSMFFFLFVYLTESVAGWKNFARKDAKDAKKDKSKRGRAVFRNKIGFSFSLPSSLRSLRLCGERFFHFATLSLSERSGYVLPLERQNISRSPNLLRGYGNKVFKLFKRLPGQCRGCSEDLRSFKRPFLLSIGDDLGRFGRADIRERF